MIKQGNISKCQQITSGFGEIGGKVITLISVYPLTVSDNPNGVQLFRHFGKGWRTEGYLHYLTNQINITPKLYNMKNKAYQADWFKTMDDYKLVERVDERFGYFIRSQIPEKSENLWESKFKEYEFVDWVQIIYNRHTLLDKSMGSDSNENVNANIDSEINIRMVKKFGKSPRTFQLQCSTKKIYPLLNYSIYTVCRHSSNGIDISFKGIITPSVGPTMVGPTTVAINLEALNNGTYTLNFYNEDFKHTGELIVSSDKYEMNFADQPSLNFINTPLNRIPEQTIWGTVGYHKQESSSLVQSFITELTNAGAEKKSYNPGFYNEFNIDNTGDIVQPGDNSGYWFIQSFIYHYTGDVEDIARLVQRYAHDYGEDMSIGIYTNKGEGILSWLCK